MKKMIFFLFLLVNLAASATPIKVDEKVQKQFAQAFPAARAVVWYSSETHYQVVFLNDDLQCRITYRLDGAVEKTERYFSERHLPPYTLVKVKSKYAGYRIHGVTEITTEAGVVYHLVLEGDKKWLQVQADESGHSYITRRFNRQETALMARE